MNVDLELLKDLIRIPSVSADVDAVNSATDFLHAYLENRGLHCTIENCNGRRVLFAATVPGKQPDYLFNAHLDVVPAEKEQFEPSEDGEGRLSGRGASDCKGPAVVIAQILCDLAGKASVGAIFTADEEIGGSTTAAMVARGYGAKRLVCIVDADPYCIVNAQKGAVTFKLIAHGRGGHSSEPWNLENPIEKLMNGFRVFSERWPAPTEDRWCDTMAPTVLQAGKVGNMVPDTAELTVNFRFIEEGGEEKIAKRLRELTGLDVELVSVSPPVFSDISEPEMQRLQRVLAAQWPDREIRFSHLNGATDSRHFVSLGIPVAVLGVDGFHIHCASEGVWTQSLHDYAEALERFVLEARES